MSFERFTGKRVSLEEPAVTLTAYGTMIFNAAALRELKLENYSHAELYFDTASDRVGVRFCDSNGNGAYSLTHHIRERQRRGKAVYISCRMFFRQHNIPRRRLTQRLAWDGREKLWTFKLPSQ